MDLYLISNEGFKKIDEFVDKFTRVTWKYRDRLRNLLDKGRQTLKEKRGRITALNLRNVKKWLEKRRDINDLEREIKGIVNGDASFKEDYISSSLILETTDYMEGISQEDIGYSISINLLTNRINFEIDPEILEIDTAEYLQIRDLEKPDKSHINWISTAETLDDIAEAEENLNFFEADLKDFEELLDDFNFDTLTLKDALEKHKTIVQEIDYVLRRFAKSHAFEYETNHNYPLLGTENKNQLKLFE